MYGSSTVESTKVAVLRFHRMLFTYCKARTKLLKRNARTISITNPPIQSALHTPLKRGGGCGRRLGLVYAGGRPARPSQYQCAAVVCHLTVVLVALHVAARIFQAPALKHSATRPMLPRQVLFGTTPFALAAAGVPPQPRAKNQRRLHQGSSTDIASRFS